MPGLFDSYSLKDIALRNRIVVSPMCQYMSTEGVANDWHRVHYTSLARGGAGLVILEATAVSPEGRISWGDAGLWNDEQAAALKLLADQWRNELGDSLTGKKGNAVRPMDPLEAKDPVLGDR